MHIHTFMQKNKHIIKSKFILVTKQSYFFAILSNTYTYCFLIKKLMKFNYRILLKIRPDQQLFLAWD